MAPDPRFLACDCAGARPDCPRCDGEGIMEVVGHGYHCHCPICSKFKAESVPLSLEYARTCFRLLWQADRASVFGKCTEDPCPTCSAMEALQEAIIAAEEATHV